MKWLWLGVLVAVMFSALIFFSGLASASGAPQQAAVVGIALAVTVLPYCFVRACEGIADHKLRAKLLAHLANTDRGPEGDGPKPD